MRGLVLALLIGLTQPVPAFDFGELDLRKLDLDKAVKLISKGKEAFAEVPQAREIELGRGMAASLLGAVPLVPDPGLQRYVNDLGHWLALHTERPGLPWRFGILDTMTANAFATPGGHVFVTRGLLLRLWNEAELAGVLAHEIGHVLRRHHLQAVQHRARLELGMDVLSTALEERTGFPLDRLTGIGMELYARGLDKGDEYEADRLGVVIAARSGYDPYGLPGVLYTLAASGAQDSDLALMFSTHPSPQSRLERLSVVMDGRLPETGATVRSRFDRYRARLEEGH